MLNNKTIAAVIVAAGASTRMGFDKLSYKINGVSVLEKSIRALAAHPYIDSVVVVCTNERAAAVNTNAFCGKPYCFVKGGAERYLSVKNGAEKANADIIAIHDAARPFVSAKIITDVIDKALQTNAAAPCVAVKDTIKQASGGIIKQTPHRSSLFAVQTPQVFDKQLYFKALSALPKNSEITDDCCVLELAGYEVALTRGEYENYKITTADDLKEEKSMRIGHGYDVHRLCEGRKLILGGVLIEYDKGLLGHSDADVLTHAVADALLGAAALGDIGLHFPDNNAEFKDADSIELLKRVVMLIKAEGYELQNLDATILCQAPKLRPHIDKMRQNLANALCTEASNVNIKATTEEGLGFTGKGEGIAAHAVVFIR